MDNIWWVVLQSVILGWTLGWQLRGYLEAQRCLRHHSAFCKRGE